MYLEGNCFDTNILSATKMNKKNRTIEIKTIVQDNDENKVADLTVDRTE